MKCSKGAILLALYVAGANGARSTLYRGLRSKQKLLSKKEVMAKMSREAAAAQLLRLDPDPDLVRLLEAHFGRGLAHLTNSAAAHQHQAATIQVGSRLRAATSTRAGQTGRATSADVAKARSLLNRMITETHRKLDIETLTGMAYEDSALETLTELRGEIAQANAEAAAARGGLLESSATINEMESKMPQLRAQLKRHQEACEQESAEFSLQTQILRDDLLVMNSLLNLTQCEGATSVSFLACGQCEAGVRTFGIHHPSIGEALKRLKSEKARQYVQQALSELFEDDNAVQPISPASRMTLSFLQEEAGLYTFNQSWDFRQPKKMKGVDDFAVPSGCDEVTNKCTISKTPSCALVVDRFTKLDGSIRDMHDESMEKIAKKNKYCEDMSAMYRQEVEEMDQRHSDELARQAQGTKQVVDAERMSHQLAMRDREVEKDLHHKQRELCDNKNQLLSELCALEKIRGELLRMKGLDANVQDCEVGDWVRGPCSATCGGGKRRSTRSVTIQPVDGAKCPALLMEEDCGHAPCPTDCVLDDWSGWSSCSAACGGGVMTRQRYVRVTPENKGAPCGETLQSVSCNIESCDADCALSDWSEWGSCSKACNAGVQMRSKIVVQEARGAGACPPIQSQERTQHTPCNQFDCADLAGRGDKVVTCRSKLDLVVIVDSSASLRSEGWEAFKSVTANLTQLMQGGPDGVKLAVLVASGPGNWANFNACVKGAATNPETQCGMKWVSRLSDDPEAVVPKIRAAEWIGQSMQANLALRMANEELQNGRHDARAAVIVVSGSSPMSFRSTGQEARFLQKRAQLAWVLVGHGAPLSTYVLRNKWASRPYTNSLVTVKNFRNLNSRRVLNQIISGVCPMVG